MQQVEAVADCRRKSMQQVTIPNLNANETGYQTAGGNYVAVSYSKGQPRIGYLCVLLTARVVDQNGVEQNDADGQPLVIKHAFSTRGDNITATHTLNDEKLDWLDTAEPYIDHEVAAQQHLASLVTGLP